MCTDGLVANSKRGGGQGLINEEVADIVSKSNGDPQELAETLVAAAQDAGSTDDITVTLLKLT